MATSDDPGQREQVGGIAIVANCGVAHSFGTIRPWRDVVDDSLGRRRDGGRRVGGRNGKGGRKGRFGPVGGGVQDHTPLG